MSNLDRHMLPAKEMPHEWLEKSHIGIYTLTPRDCITMSGIGKHLAQSGRVFPATYKDSTCEEEDVLTHVVALPDIDALTTLKICFGHLPEELMAYFMMNSSSVEHLRQELTDV